MELLISGASTGIGRAAAIHFSRLGHRVWAGVRSDKSFEDLRKLNINGLHPVRLDVCDEASIKTALSEIKKTAGLLHGLVNNAGIVVSGPVEGVPVERWREQFETNVFGQIRVIQEALPLLRQSKGRIVNISSISGRVASPFLGPYAASKFALEAVSDSLRRELKPQGIQVSVIEPGPIATPIWEKSKDRGVRDRQAIKSEIAPIYDRALDRFQEQTETAARDAAPVSVVLKALEHALLHRQPRTRYPVGKGIPLTDFLVTHLPDPWVDKIMARRL